jgi:hypothetical protein
MFFPDTDGTLTKDIQSMIGYTQIEVLDEKGHTAWLHVLRNNQPVGVISYNRHQRRDGKSYTISDTGMLHSSYDFKNGKLDGFINLYDSQGLLSHQLSYKNGCAHGCARTFNWNGQECHRDYYWRGRLVSERAYRLREAVCDIVYGRVDKVISRLFSKNRDDAAAKQSCQRDAMIMLELKQRSPELN